MHLVDGHRLMQQIRLGPSCHPGVVAPGVFADVPHDRGRLRARFGEEALRVGLLHQRVRPALDLELVGGSLAQPRDEELPDARTAALAHRVAPAVPAVEIAHDAHAQRVGRPDGEDDTLNAVERDDVCAELVIGAEVVALVEQQQVEVAQDRQEAVGVAVLPLLAVLVRRADLVGETPLALRGTAPRRSRCPRGAPSRRVRELKEPGG